MGRAKSGEKPQPKKKKAVKSAPAARIHTPSSEIPRSKETKNNGQKEGKQQKWAELTELSDKHMYFAKRYALNENACKAAREAGFNEWYASVRLVKEPLIIKEVARIRAARAKKFDVSADRIIAELTKVAFGTLDDFVALQKDGTPVIDCSDVGRPEMAAVSEITQDIYPERVSGDDGEYESIAVKKTKIKLHSKTQALEQLGRIFKLFGDGDGLDKDTPEEKAAKIRKALLAMARVDGEKVAAK